MTDRQPRDPATGRYAEHDSRTELLAALATRPVVKHQGIIAAISTAAPQTDQ